VAGRQPTALDEKGVCHYRRTSSRGRLSRVQVRWGWLELSVSVVSITGGHWTGVHGKRGLCTPQGRFQRPSSRELGLVVPHLDGPGIPSRARACDHDRDLHHGLGPSLRRGRLRAPHWALEPPDLGPDCRSGRAPLSLDERTVEAKAIRAPIRSYTTITGSTVTRAFDAVSFPTGLGSPKQGICPPRAQARRRG